MSKQSIQMRRNGQRLECASPVWVDLLEAIPSGVDLNVTITRARSVKQNGTYWGVLAWLISDGPERFGETWLTKDELSDALQLEVGFVRQIKLANGLIYGVPRSKNFEECSQDVFNAYFDAAQRKLHEWCGWDAVAAYLEHMAARGMGRAA